MPPVLVKPAEQIDTAGEQIMGTQIEAANASVYEASSLPAGLSISSETGKVTGIPTTVEETTVTATAKGTSGEASTTFKWRIVPDVTAISLPDQLSRKNEPIHLKLEVPGAGEYTATGLPT